MKFLTVVAILAASCAAAPLSEVDGSGNSIPTVELSPVDAPPAELEPLNANLTSLVARDTGPDKTCPAGQTYDRSVCYKYNTIRRFCVANPRSNREDIKDTPCRSDEICVQRNLSNGKSFAQCIELVKLIRWKTGAGNAEGCTSVSVKSGGYHSIGTILYDTNSNPIQVDKIRYLGEPGDVNEGIGGGSSYFNSDFYNFGGGHSMKACVFTGGYGNLNAFSWVI
ncbi:hypothetical protein C8035_v008514 [Colletotrichum spinosum]|uniref:Secreted in xylem 6 n=1 Tax=Colletotrichum spinosum TaxID=1347390 RepID=A0A4V3HSL7_9PEZI|nr:hypothetical protein C8035_v008514 [Colletotrichum spinosum]